MFVILDGTTDMPDMDNDIILFKEFGRRETIKTFI